MGRQRSPVGRPSASAARADGIACPAAQIAGARVETIRRLRHPASAAIVALFLAFLGFSFCGNAKAAGVVSWTADGYGTPYDPDAHPSLYRWSHAKKAIAAGADGTVYVTGSTAPQGDEVLTIKYNRINGAAEWRVFARGVSNVFGGGSAIAVDAGGNVYVAGALSYNSPAFGIGFVTLKYDQNGVEVWRTLDTTPQYAYAEALALDAAGNVYVAGRLYPAAGSSASYLTIKYDSNGIEQWRATVSDAIAVDTPVSLGLDSTGNVYLAAMTNVSGRNGFLVVKYDGSGAEWWRAAPKASPVSDDTFSQAAFDASGNVYLTGTSVDASTTRAFTIKYEYNGVERWRVLGQASREDSQGIAVDGSGNVYVSGTAVGGGCGNRSAVAAKYDPSGVQQWRTLSGICNRDVFGASIAVDAALNVMVTGSVDFGGDSDYMTIKYSASGAELWRARATGTPTSHDEGLALVTDGAGNTYVTGTSDADGNEDWLTIKYNTAGVEQWRANEGVAWTDALFASGQEFSRQRAMATDAQGNVYVTGYVEPINHAVDFFNLQTIKLDSNGAELWRAAATTPGGDSLGHALAVDGTGSVYVTGRSGINNDLSYLTVKYDTAGQQLWEARSHAADGRSDFPVAVAVDSAGNVVVTGYSYDLTTSEYFTVKYDGGGIEQWRRSAHGSLQGNYLANALLVDPAGNVYVSGFGTGSNTDDCMTISYAPDGVERWRATCNDAATVKTETVFLALDPNGYVYLVGLSANGGTFGFLMIKYSASGVEQWRTFVKRNDSYPTTALGAVADAAGNVYAVGITNNNGIDYDYLTVKLDRNGVEQWQAVAIGARGFQYGPVTASLTVDGGGNVYIIGNSAPSPQFGYMAVKYDPAGHEVWRMNRSNPARSESMYAVALAPGGLYAAGDGFGPTAPPLMIVQKIVDSVPSSTTTLASSPNPSVAGQGVMLTAIVTGSSPTGTVSFVNDSVAIAGCSLVPMINGQAVCMAGPFTIDIHAIAARYSGDSQNLASISPTLPQNVLRAPTTTSAGSSPNPSALNQNVQFTAVVAGLAPTGTITFTDNSYGLSGCVTVPLVAGKATCTTALIFFGARSIAAIYSGDDTNAPSTSATFTQLVGSVTATTLSASPNPSNFGQNVSFTASVTGTLLTGTVDFRDGTNAICVAVPLKVGKSGGPKATCVTSTLSAGSHTVTAKYSGDASNLSSTSAALTQVVNGPPPGVSLTSSLNPSKPGESVTFTAKVTGQAPTGTVTFKDGSSALCSAAPLQGGGNSPVATCTTGVLTIGSHSITAAYSGDANNVAATSPVLTQTVKQRKR